MQCQPGRANSPGVIISVSKCRKEILAEARKKWKCTADRQSNKKTAKQNIFNKRVESRVAESGRAYKYLDPVIPDARNLQHLRRCLNFKVFQSQEINK